MPDMKKMAEWGLSLIAALLIVALVAMGSLASQVLV